MNYKTILLSLTIAATAVTLNSCAPNIGGNDYTVGQTGEMNALGVGHIVSKKAVKVYAKDKGVGDIAGGVTGAVLGSAVGGGRGAVVGAIGGAVAGGVVGNKIEKAANEQTGYRYIVKTTAGHEFSVVQGATPDLKVGQKVTIVYGKKLRVVNYEGN